VSLPFEFAAQMRDFELVPVLTPSTGQALPKTSPAANADGSVVATSANAIAAAAPIRRALKELVPLVFIFILAFEGWLLLFTIL
jgi:hypothetical protein